jgi:hypothetical protein
MSSEIELEKELFDNTLIVGIWYKEPLLLPDILARR